MLDNPITALPLAPIDRLFASGLAWLAPRVKGRACLSCQSASPCGTCACPQGPNCGQLLCDDCDGVTVCGCYCPPEPIC